MNGLDEQLVKDLVTADNPRALDVIYDTLGSRLYRHILGIMGSVADTEDVFQDLFIRLARNNQKLLKAHNMQAYLFAMARNQAWTAIRRRGQHTASIDNCLEPVAEENNPRSDSNQIGAALRALKKLPLKQRMIITMKCLEDMTFAEIAHSLNISINTAASRYRYATAKLRKIMRFNSEE